MTSKSTDVSSQVRGRCVTTITVTERKEVRSLAVRELIEHLAHAIRGLESCMHEVALEVFSQTQNKTIDEAYLYNLLVESSVSSYYKTALPDFKALAALLYSYPDFNISRDVAMARLVGSNLLDENKVLRDTPSAQRLIDCETSSFCVTIERIREERKENIVTLPQLVVATAKHAKGLDVDVERLCAEAFNSMPDKIQRRDFNSILCRTALHYRTHKPDYKKLAARLYLSHLYESIPTSFSDVIKEMHEYGSINDSFARYVDENKERLDALVAHEKQERLDRDYACDMISLSTRSALYLLSRTDSKRAKHIRERPQHMWLRAALAASGKDFDGAVRIYDRLSRGDFILATPALYNGGMKNQQLSSCFLLRIKEDSSSGIFDSIKDCAMISKAGGGIGLHISDIRASGSRVKSSNGEAAGILPFLSVLESSARFMNQSGRRKGGIAVYLETFHRDFEAAIMAKLKTSGGPINTPDLWFGAWVSDVFMKRVESDGIWTFFCPTDAPGLVDSWGEHHERLYERYERTVPKERCVVKKAREVLKLITNVQIQEGNPYVLFKDAFNRRHNLSHLGTLTGSNLCTEMGLLCTGKETGVCNLGSLCLPRYVKTHGNGKKYFCYESLIKATEELASCLSNVTAETNCPTPEAKLHNQKYRPIGIGLQGLADVFHMLKLSYVSLEAQEINHRVSEAILYGAIRCSISLAQKHGTHCAFEGSQFSQGILPFDQCRRPVILMDEKFSNGAQIFDSYNNNGTVKTFLDWTSVRQDLRKHGMYNAYLVAPMPTSSSSLASGFSPSFEPYHSNYFSINTLHGLHEKTNPFLVDELSALGLWDAEMLNEISLHDGSVQNISRIPLDIKERYKTVWEYKTKLPLVMAHARGLFVDQSQSFNLFLENPEASLASVLLLAWRLGMKTGCYYLHTPQKSNNMKIEASKQTLTKAKDEVLIPGQPTAAAGATVKDEVVVPVKFERGDRENFTPAETSTLRPANVQCTGDVCVYCQ